VYILPDGYEVDDPSLNDIKVSEMEGLSDIFDAVITDDAFLLVRFESHFNETTSVSVGP
jgi:hypothetical protein